MRPRNGSPSQGVDPLQTVWARYTVSVVLVSFFVNQWTSPGVLRTSRPVLQVARSILLMPRTILNFIALQYLQLAETISILFATPLPRGAARGPDPG